MKWSDFQRNIEEKDIALFSIKNAQDILGVKREVARVTLHRWVRNENLVRLKRGLYAIRGNVPPHVYLANKLREPSYISLEFALSYHRIIPETVYEITSVTTKSPRRFTADNTRFTYRHIKRSAFFGYGPRKQGNFTFFLANPEKAYVDLVYFRMLSQRPPLSRFHKHKLNAQKATRFAQRFNNSKLVSRVKTSLR